ncbi:pancreatic lipase-related protein 2-like [Anticarsia gemmatalis]|uniref:pancreatic lipase-related protein 2-like n=1 Tax=Anticarsia gemmatalis TaxID=129554 RepID=UPI003F75DADF
MLKSVAVLCVLAVAAALPYDPVVKKLENGERFQHIEDGDGTLHLADTWLTASAVATPRYDPDRQNVYHLYTRQNPTVSQPLLMGSQGLLGITNYNPARRTIILIHGWMVDVTAAMNTVLVPAFLSAEDVNVIVVDWSAGAGSINYATAVANTVPAGESIARFVTWLNGATGAVSRMYHIIGHSLGGHMAGIIGRNLGGQVGYITALEPASPGFIFNDDKFRPNDGAYTEVIHTNAGVLGYLSTLGHVDFYPNGGINMPGCNSQECDHARSYFYLAESLTSGGFTGRRCASYVTAMTGNCFLLGNLRMGGLVPKTGSSGIFYLETNAEPPFSRG